MPYSNIGKTSQSSFMPYPNIGLTGELVFIGVSVVGKGWRFFFVDEDGFGMVGWRGLGGENDCGELGKSVFVYDVGCRVLITPNSG